MLTLLRWLAAALGVGLVAGETIRSWGVARPLYAVVDDFVMAILLFTAAAGGARRGGLAWLCGAYGFSAGMLYASFFLHLASRPIRATCLNSCSPRSSGWRSTCR